MGSAAPRRDRYGAVRAVLVSLEVEARRVHPATGSSSDPNAAALLRAALADPALRDDLISFLGPFLARVLTGSIPDYSVWEPPT